MEKRQSRKDRKELEMKNYMDSNDNGISMISVVVTVIVIIILASISIYFSSNLPNQAMDADILSELSQVQELVSIKRKENMQYRDRNKGFTLVKIVNAPSDFVSASEEGIYGYVVDLAAIGAKNSRYGSEYSTFTANDTVTFGTNDVYVYDKDGNVYYARGGGSLDNDTPIYQVDGKTEFGGLVIESVITTLDASKTKVTVAIDAYSKDGSDVTVTVGGESATSQGNHKYNIEKTENGTYEIIATDDFGNKVNRQVVVSGIGSTEAGGTPPTVNALSGGSIVNRQVILTGKAIDADDGIIAYAFSMGSGIPASGWNDIDNTKTQIIQTYMAEQSGTYYFWVKNAYNQVASLSAEITIPSNRYLITYHTNGGTWSNSSDRTQSKDGSETITIITEEPTKTGYTFLGWATSSGATSAEYTGGSSYSREADLNLYAVWTEATDTVYKIEHYQEDSNGQYVLAEVENATGTTGKNVIAGARTYEGYAENTSHPDTIARGTIRADGSLVLKLYYSLKTYRVSITAAHATVTGSGNYKPGATVTIGATPSTGYTFSEWIVIDGAATGIHTTSATTSFTMPIGNVTIQANCIGQEYSISYQLNGGTVSPANPTSYNTSEPITLRQPTKDGYRFKGWTGSNGTTPQKIVTISNTTGNKSYTANYEKLFTLAIVSNGSSQSAARIQVTSVDNVRYQYSTNNGSSWKDCDSVVLIDGKYITYVVTSVNGTVKVRALKANGQEEAVESITVSSVSSKKSKVNAPVLTGSMKAVYRSGSTQKTADSFTDSMYDYTATSSSELTNAFSIWANAMTEDGSMWVWIPRFAYKIVYYTDANRTVETATKTAYEKIMIEFIYGTDDTKYVEKDTGTVKTLPSGYVVPTAAFNYNGSAKTGFWIAKYEASATLSDGSLGGGNVLTTNAGSIEDLGVVSKAGTKSWRGISYENALSNAQKMYTKYNTDLTSNAEWEAVAILAQSIYGINTSTMVEGSSYTTGTGGSTTNNWSGVYDWGGNAWEYVKGSTGNIDATLIQYLDNVIDSNTSAASIIGKTVRGSVSGASDNFPVNGAPDSRIGYRISLHNN